MAVTKFGIISKANSIRFANRNGLLPSMDNKLWNEETWATAKDVKYCQTFFQNDEVLLQVKAGPTATVTVKLYGYDGSVSTLTADDTTAYSGVFTIYDYLITFSSLGSFYITVETEIDSWESEYIEVIESEDDYLLIQWTNLDQLNDTFEFDYQTTYATNYVNFARVRGEMLDYKPAGESTVYDNQNEISKIKSNYYRVLTMNTETIPRQLAEKLIIAMQHDTFMVNDVAYVSEELPDLNRQGGWFPISADLKLVDSLGLNTHDIGLDSTTTSNVEVKEIEGATGNGTFTISAGYMVISVVIEKVSGTPLFKAGSTVSGDEIVLEETIADTTPPAVFNTQYTPDFADASWTFYYTLSGGTINLSVVTVPHRQ